jgi:hypothetical protein
MQMLSSTCLLGASLFLLATTVPAATGACRRPKLVVSTIRYGDCQPKRVLVVACIGTCPSYARISPTNSGEIEHSCQCCGELDKINIPVQIRCPDSNDGLRIVHIGLSIPISCMCRPCSSLPDTLQPSESGFLSNQPKKRFGIDLLLHNTSTTEKEMLHTISNPEVTRMSTPEQTLVGNQTKSIHPQNNTALHMSILLRKITQSHG